MTALSPLLATSAVTALYVFFYSYFLHCSEPTSDCNPLGAIASPLSKHSSGGAMRVTSYVGEAMWTLCNGVHTIVCIAAIIVSVVIIYHLLSDYPVKVRWLVILLIIIMAADASLLFALWTSTDVGAPAPQLMGLTVVRVLPKINNYNRLFDALGLTAALSLTWAACATLWQAYPGSVHDEQEIRGRIRMLRYILYVGAVMLVIGVFRLSVMLNWAASFFAPEGAEAKTVAGLNSSIITLQGSFYTLMLTALYLPAALLLRYRARQLATAQPPEEQESWLQKHGLTLSFTDYLPRILAILGPLMAGPIGELLGRAFKSS